MFLRICTVCALLCSGVQAADTAGFLYDCTMEDTDQAGGWISPRIAIVLRGDATASVVDALTLTFAEGPVGATILRDDQKRLILKWSLANVRADAGRSFAYFDYRASLNKATGEIALTAAPRGFDTGLRGSGTCRKRSE